jgi:AmmeMemoRadiSam system protein A
MTKSEQQIALKLARWSLGRELGVVDEMGDGGGEDYKNHKIFQEKRGVFVTLHKNEELRGCIGLIELPDVGLDQAIQQMAVSAGLNDYRFPPVTKDELDKIKFEISVLSVPKKIENINQIELGKHGVIIKKGIHQGVFLPQVVSETGWNKEEFLSELCEQKAGLDKNCWQDLTQVEIYVFEAEVFGEK